MRIKNLLIIVFVFVALSLAAYSLNKITKVQITKDISLEDIQDCETVYWNETNDVYGTCTYDYNITVCDDEPFNTSCHIEEKTNYYECKTGTETIQKSKETCVDKEIQFTIDKLEGQEKYNLQYGEWGKCSYTSNNETLTIICDSMYDGNNDGICTSGESCTQFRITKDNIQRLMKNSRDNFVEDDETFFLDKLNVEVVK